MALTQREIAQQMIRQLRVLDPSVSADLGTPERKIIDTTAQALADAQLDLTALAGALDLDSKFGTTLDRFLALFGFARQKSVPATGFVKFSRISPSNVDIRIPAGTQVATGVDLSDLDTINRQAFYTVTDTILRAGQLEIFAAIRGSVAGVRGNVAANTINSFIGTVTLGITDVTNPAPTTGGQDEEGDDSFKLRFKNTVFRNVSGTTDQFLALSVSTAYTTKANVVGPISRYREYIQVPNVDDSAADTVEDASGNPILVSGNRSTGGSWTSALSTIPYSKYVYSTVPSFISNGETGVLSVFFQEGVDYLINTLPADKYYGDTYRLASVGAGSNPLSDHKVDQQPNVTFVNVYTETVAAVQAIRPGDIVLFEHSYLSSESRNDLERHVTNCVDIFVDGGNDQLGTAVIPKPDFARNKFSDDPADRFYAGNFQRIGEPGHRPVVGTGVTASPNHFTPLIFQPISAIPDVITAGGNNYYKGIHYWLVEDVTELAGTVRARNGIEWSASVKGQNPQSADPVAGPYTGSVAAANTAITSLEVANYQFDRNIIELQAVCEGAKQTTTDVLVHKAKLRYFKLDVSIIYSAGASPTQVNAAVQQALTIFLSGQYFGATIQLSDLLQVIHNTPGVDNVRWTNDVDNTKAQVTETNIYGEPIHAIVSDRVAVGGTALPEKHRFYFTGNPTGGVYKLKFGNLVTGPLAHNANTAAINAALTAATIPASVTSGTGVVTDPYIVTFSSNGWRTDVITGISTLIGDGTLKNDFYLKDNELPALASTTVTGDTLPGLIIRPRAQNTWQR